MGDLLPGTTVLASDTPVSQVSVQDSSFSTTTTSYTTAASAGSYADCAVVYTAPTTGRVRITMSGRITSSGSGIGGLLGPETRIGSTVGSGTIVESAGDRGPSNYTGQFAKLSAVHVLTGLSPNQVYNTRLLHKVSAAGTATFALRELIVEPMT